MLLFQSEYDQYSEDYEIDGQLQPLNFTFQAQLGGSELIPFRLQLRSVGTPVSPFLVVCVNDCK